MADNELIHERWKCIACGACAGVTPEFWFMDDDDFKSHIKTPNGNKVEKNSVGQEDVEERLKLKDESEVKKNVAAAEACPVQCIHVKKEGNQLI